MTIKNLREYIAKEGKIPMYGMMFKLLDEDLVRIFILNNVFETTYKKFIDLKNNLALSDSIFDKDITSMRIVKDDKLQHTMVLNIDTRIQEIKPKKPEGGAKAGMKYI
jgi:hypothetical protein